MSKESHQMSNFRSYTGISPGRSLIIRLPCGPPNNFSCGLLHNAVGTPASGSFMRHRMVGISVAA
jgi:hypothetical protein